MANNPLQMLYFDTNIFRGTSDDNCKQLRRLADANNTLCFYPPRVLIEILSHINSTEKDDFPTYQSYLRRLKILCSDNILPDYHQALAIHLKTGRKFEKGSDDLKELRNIIISSQSYEDSLREESVWIDGKQYSVERLEDGLKEFRERYENAWVKMFNDVTERGDASRDLASLEFKQLFLDAVTKTAGAHPICKLSLSQIDEFLEPIEAYFSAKKWITRQWIFGQYSLKKIKNDFHDLRYLIYLGNEKLFFITNDKKIRGKIDKSCKQRERILTFEEAMERLQGI